jgi:hypothetical protein
VGDVGLIGENRTIEYRPLTGGFNMFRSSFAASGGSRKIHGGDEALGAVDPGLRRQGQGPGGVV